MASSALGQLDVGAQQGEGGGVHGVAPGEGLLVLELAYGLAEADDGAGGLWGEAQGLELRQGERVGVEGGKLAL